MTGFQIIMLAISAFFAYKVYEHIGTLEDKVTNEAVEDNNSNFDKLIEKADEAFEKGDKFECKKLLREASFQKKGDIDTLTKLGFLEAEEENYDDAIAYAKEALEVDENSHSVHSALASFYRKKKMFHEAKVHYEKAIELENNHEYYYFNYANLLVDMEDIEGAKKMYARAIELNPDFIQAKFELEKLK